MRKIIFFLILSTASHSVSAQTPHEKPEHPRGNMAAQLEALPFYNEACELYARGEVGRAKIALFEAINTSFSLTEAQLFLADIYYKEGKTDSAFYFYNSGLDFVVEQKPHYYFRLFETALQLGKYDYLKHNISHFKKLYGSRKDLTPYEEDYPYNYADFEKYEAIIAFVYDYTSWKPAADVNTVEKTADNACIGVLDKEIYFMDNKGLKKIIQKKNKQKNKKIKGLPENVNSFCISPSKKQIIYSLTAETGSKLYWGKINGNKISSLIMLSAEINTGGNVSDPFFCSDSSLYFSSDKSGNLDIYVTKIDLEKNECTEIKALDRCNTERDERGSFFDESTKQFYFASNGRTGFGGFDLYICRDYEIMDELLRPINPRNLGSPYNSNNDEIQICIRQSDKHLILRRENGLLSLLHLTPITYKSIDYDTRIIKYNKNDD